MPSKQKEYKINRIPEPKDQSLKAWSAADEYLLSCFNDLKSEKNNLAIYNDRFGYLTCHLNEYSPTLIITNKSQEKSIQENIKKNKIGIDNINFINPLEEYKPKANIALIKIPKSLELFKLFLYQVCNNSSDNIEVICSFMTRHFSPQILKIASDFFNDVEQSKAKKKSRLLILKNKKENKITDIIQSFDYKGNIMQQYAGVFSAKHIDYATQFLLEHLEVKNVDNKILDLASGNGIIAKEIRSTNESAEIHLLDDFYLAIASSQLNINSKNTFHHFNDSLEDFEDEYFDLIVSNPPFHFEYEINIQIPLELFKEAHRCLQSNGNFQLVANKHLNYKTHLIRLFSIVETIAENDKFIVYQCKK